MTFLHTTQYRRRRLPHWEVQDGRYFVTVRLADSLPRAAVAKLQEIHHTLGAITPQTSQFAALQRQYFRSMEKYLDSGIGGCALQNDRAAACLVREFEALRDWEVGVPHYTIMPNHWHAIIVPEGGSSHSLASVMKRLKGRTAKAIRAVVGGSGPVWQSEWFDRWIRDDAEWIKIVEYIQQNPARARIVTPGERHRWTC